jgi:hypothetical protein
MLLQEMAINCMELLPATADALADWSAAVGKAIEQHQMQPQLTNSGQRQSQPNEAVSRLHATTAWLQMAVCSLLLCVREQRVCVNVNKQHLLDIIVQLLRKVVPLPPPPLHRILQIQELLSL